MREKCLPFLLRLPPALHRQLVRQAKKNHRSLNSEIIAQLLGPQDRRTVVEETIKTLVQNGDIVERLRAELAVRKERDLQGRERHK